MRKVDPGIPTLLGHLVADARVGLVRAGGCPLDACTWREAIGERIATRSSPEHLRDGVLTLRVASSVWAQELSLLSQTIIERLAPLGFRVQSIRCRVGALDQTEARRRVAPPAPRMPPVELPPELNAELNRIDDPDLRTTIESAARAQLQLRKDRATQRQRERRTTSRGQQLGAPKAERDTTLSPTSSRSRPNSAPAVKEIRAKSGATPRSTKD
ncbi:MAG TPA: DUF721 domain-containing protein [Polyangiaceae bacterium]|nr:DUF721 domain-containing protein [Polyangiaceae bacterium]